MEDGELWVRDGTDSGEAKEMGGSVSYGFRVVLEEGRTRTGGQRGRGW